MLVLLLTCLCFYRTTADDSLACGRNQPEVFSAPKGDIYSPGYGQTEYPNNVFCSFLIKASPGHRILLSFVHVDVEVSEHCSRDLLAVHEGVNGTFPVHLLLCGNNTIRPIISVANALFIAFRSDFMIGGKGFHLQYTTAASGLGLCSLGYLTCRNRNCYTVGQRCDGIDHCDDGTDEENCGMPLPTAKCGVPAIPPDLTLSWGSDRVIGGREARPGSWPWQADLQLSYVYPNGHACGGTLINAQWVLSAAHCFLRNPRPQEWRIHLGKHNKFRRDGGEQIRYVKRLVVYPGPGNPWPPGAYDPTNDVALLQLNAPVNLTKEVSLACLPHQGQQIQPAWKTRCIASGWGMTRGTGSSAALKQVDMSILDGNECVTKENPKINDKTMLCTRNAVGYQDVCHGDSGGPLACLLGSEWYVVGATSYGTYSNRISGMCGLPGSGTIFAKISDKINWIRDMISRSGQ